MRIGLATDFYFPWVGGPAALLRNLGQGLSRRGHEVFLLAPSATGASGVELEGAIEVTRVRTVPAPFGFRLRMAAIPDGHVSRWLDRVKPDVLHIHHPFPLSARAVFAANARRIAVAATNHTIPECSLWGIRSVPLLYPVAREGLGAWIVFLLNRCLRVATPTDSAAQLLRDIGYRRPISIISNGIDTRRFSPGPEEGRLRTQLGLDERPIVLYAGRLDAEKEMDVWLQCAARLVPDAQVQFVIGGDGTDRRRLEHLARTLGLSDHVRFVGYLPEAEFPGLYRLAALYLITSPVELQSITTLEALATGLPVVGVNAAALPELVHNGENGYCVPPGDAGALAAACRALLTDGALKARMASRGRELALLHDLEQSVQAYEEFLEATASMRRGAGRDRPAAVGS